MSLNVRHSSPGRAPANLAERFWSLARVMEDGSDGDPKSLVAHVLAVLDRLDAGAVGEELTANTLSFLALLRQQELRGDLLYASPEQARGEQMDERSLVFSVGVLLFEKLTGRHPFGAEGNPNRLARIRRGELASGVNYFPKVPSALRAVLLRAMGPFPEDRYGSLEELRSELEAFLADRPVRAQTQAEPALPEQIHPTAVAQPGHQASGKRRRDAWSSFADEFDDETTVMPRKRAVVHENDDDHTQMTVKKSPAWLVPVGWAVVGALLASVGFVAAGASGPASPAAPAAAPALAISSPLAVAENPPAAEASAAPAAAAVPPTVAEPLPDEAADSGAAAAQPEAADEPVAALAAPAEFDPDFAGEAAIEAARECFTAVRLNADPSFGASLLFRKTDPASAKVYFGASGELTPAERGCLVDALTGVSAGTAPEDNTIVVYSFFLDADGGRYRARVKE